MPPVITLTTDFGTSDSYVGTMKGVILGICPHAQIVDITHAIAPQDVAAAARLLPTFAPFFPAGTIHVVVVDPGVGSVRRALAVATPEAFFIAPDNGVLTTMWGTAQARHGETAVTGVELTEPRFWRSERSATFHGRDIFAPVAAHLATGVTLASLGRVIPTITELPLAEPLLSTDGCLHGVITAIDHFGNSITNISVDHLAAFEARDVRVQVGDIHLCGIHMTYADVDVGDTLALIGSSGALEIAIRNGNAAQSHAFTVGDTVLVRHRG